MSRGKLKQRLIPTELGYAESEVPSRSSYLVSHITHATVLDQFYSMVVFKSIPPPSGIKFDTALVHVNPDDGMRLYLMLVDHYKKLLDERLAKSQANGVWERFGPHMDPLIPVGKVRLMDGYIKFAD